MNRISLFSASVLVCILCTTCNTPGNSIIKETQAFADIKASNSSGIKCVSNGNYAVEEATKDSMIVNVHGGIICVEN